MSDTPPQSPAADAPDTEGPPPPSSGWRPPVSPRSLAVGVVVAALGILIVLYAWRLTPFSSPVQSTDNAYVRGQITVLSPQVSGYVTQVLVTDFQAVRPGEPLVQIDDRIYRQRVDQARANISSAQAALANAVQARRSREAGVSAQEAQIASARAQLVRAQADMRRVDELVADRSVSLRERDQTRASLGQAEAAVSQARAQREIARQEVTTVAVNRGSLEAGVENAQAALRLAEIDLSNTVIRAPRAGRLSEVGVRQGAYVTAGTQLLSLVPPQMWVTANFKEKQTTRMAPGQRAALAVDALPGRVLRGRVEVISPAAGSEFSVLRPDNATGNFVKVAQRIPVRIRIDPNQPGLERLRAGMSVTARVDTASGPAR
jgi:multidrug resistance efflux pump